MTDKHGSLERGSGLRQGRFTETGRFGRMFPHLRSTREFTVPPRELGRAGGPMEGEAAPAPGGPQDNRRIKAGYTFLGQFIDHDVTFDPRSVLEQQIDPHATRNFRTPALELDSVYGLGPEQQPYLYDQTAPGHLLLAPAEEPPDPALVGDLPRNSQGRALIGDPRNDENTLVSQLHALFLRFHNRVYDTCTDLPPGRERFQEAQRLVRWHYQWIVLHEFLPRLVGQSTVDYAMDTKPWLFADAEAFMPLEFSVAAYRFGHSQIRPGYLLSAPGEPPVRAAALFPVDPGDPATSDLRGGRPIPRQRQVNFKAFFGPQAQASLRIDPKLSPSLLRLPFSVVGRPDGPGVPPEQDPMLHSLATRNLQRGIDARLPSGQTIAKYLGIDLLEDDQLWDGVPGGAGEAPLWFYILREADTVGSGHMLAGVGAEIVVRTFVAMLVADKASYLNHEPAWRPRTADKIAAVDGRFTMSDLVNFTMGTDSLDQEQLDTLPTGSATPQVPSTRQPSKQTTSTGSEAR